MNWWLIGNHHDSSWEIRACFQQAVLIIFLTMILGYTMIPDIVKLAIEVISRAMWTEIPMVNPLIFRKSHGWNFHMFSYLFSHMFPICFPYFLISSHIDLCLPTFFPIWFSYVPYVSHMFPIFPDSPQGFPTCLPSVLPHSSHMVPTCTLFFYISPNFPHQISPGIVTYVFPLFPFFFRYSPQVLPEMVPICFATFLPMFPTCFPSFNIFLQFFPYVSHMFPACFPDICFPTVFPTDFLSFPYSAPVFSHLFPDSPPFSPRFFGAPTGPHWWWTSPARWRPPAAPGPPFGRKRRRPGLAAWDVSVM